MSTFSNVASPIRIDNNIGTENTSINVGSLPTISGLRVLSLFTVPADKYAILTIASVSISGAGNTGITLASPAMASSMGVELVSHVFTPGSGGAKATQEIYVAPGKTVYFLTTAASGTAQAFISGVLFRNA